MNEGKRIKRKAKGVLLNIVLYASAAIVVLILLGIIGYILFRGLPNNSLELLTGTPSLLKGTIGILPNILNTLYMVIITLIFSIPLGVGAAVYLNEYAKNKRLVHIIELASETLSGIPSIIYGLFGMLAFVKMCRLDSSIMAGSLTLFVMTLPTVIRTTQESLKTVPTGYREGALALGSGKWHMIRTVVLPNAADGVVTGCILSIGRIAGESAALLFTAGKANEIMSFKDALKPKSAGSSLTVALYMYAKERAEFDIAFAIAAVLLILTLLINIIAKLTAKGLKRKGEN